MGLTLVRRLSTVLALPMLALLLTSACQSDQTQFLGHDISGNSSIVVGVKTDQPGTGWVPDGYTNSGFDVDVANEIGQRIGFQRSFVGVASQNRETALNHSDADHVDMVIATFSIEKDRAQHVFMAGPYAKTYQGFMVRKNDSRIKNLDDLNGKRVCAWEGANSLDVLKEEAPRVVPESVPNAADCVKDLRDHTVDAVSTDQMILYGFAQQNSDLKVIPGLTIGAANYYGVAMAKKDAQGRSNLADCERVRDALKSYVLSDAWTQDMQKDLPMMMADPGWNAYDQPTVADISRLSCTDDFEQ